MPMNQAALDVCKHCGTNIAHFKGKLWQEVGGVNYPEYCYLLRAGADSRQMHEPTSVCQYGFPKVLAPAHQHGGASAPKSMVRNPYTDEERLEHVRNYVDFRAPTAGCAVPTLWVEWLLKLYASVPGAVRPLQDRKYVDFGAFPSCDDTLKLTRIYCEVEGAFTGGLPLSAVDHSYAVWLLREYDKKVRTT